jgi:hypothetical protein
MHNFLRSIAVAGVLLVAASRPAPAQWGVTVNLQRTGFGGTSFDTSAGGTEASFRPGNSPAVTLRVDRRLGRVALGLGVRYSRSAIVLDAKDLFAGFHDEVATFEAAPEVRVRLLRTRLGASVHVFGGPVIGAWMLRDQGTRGVAGVVAGVVGEFPLIDRLALEVRVGGGLTGSLFRQGELPPVFERRTTRRSEIGLGLRFGR